MNATPKGSPAGNPVRCKPTEVGAPPETPQRNRPTKSHRSVSCPPYNPGLQQLVEGKQAWAQPLEDGAQAQGFLGWHQRGYLPHRDAPGLRQFVTFRLRDSFPASRRWEWEALLRIEDDRQRRVKLEDYLDRGYGECWLRRPEIAALAERTLRESDGQDYDLLAWIVMPNHIHVLVHIRATPLAALIRSWKGRIAREANKLLGRQGAFWEREYWDTYLRDEEQLAKARRYTEQNPVKAGLVREAQAWAWSSARLRDERGKLPRSADFSRLKPPDTPHDTNMHEPLSQSPETPTPTSDRTASVIVRSKPTEVGAPPAIVYATTSPTQS
jgi:putative transposase